MNQFRANVPCNGCRACCINDAIILHPAQGDNPALYRTKAITHPLTGKPALMLDHKPNGECVYLGTNGCTIHGHAPLICRKFDCRDFYRRYSRADRKRLVREGFADAEKFDEGRKRLHTLEIAP